LIVLMLVPVPSSDLSLGAHQATPFPGKWAGRLEIAGQPTLLWLKVSESRPREYLASVFMNPAPAGMAPQTNLQMNSDDSSWTFFAGEQRNLIHLQVRRNAQGFDAKYRVGDASGQTVLRRVSDDLASNKRLTGAYMLSRDETVYIRTGKQGPDYSLSYLNGKTGRTGFLYQETPNSYVGGMSHALPDPVGVSAMFEGNPASKLVWRLGSGKNVIGRITSAYHREEVQIPVEGAVLACEVLVPARQGTHAAVVLVPGSGAVDRFSTYYMQADVFAHHGIASLVCDKRGTGASTGDWSFESFERQAQDVAAGMQYLRQRSDVNPKRVGIWAFSQGTYPAPIAAVNGHASFLILVAGFAIPLGDATMITNVEQMHRDRASNEEIVRYKDYFIRWRQAVMNDDFKAFERAYNDYAGAPWAPRSLPTETAWKSNWQNARARLMWPYEPAPTLRQLKIPVLAFWGSEDDEALPSVHKPLLEQALRDAGNRDYSLRVLRGAGHGLWVGRTETERLGYAAEYLSGMLEWLRVTGAAARASR
jgi:hypothetical protein